ncbi:unnamed protein product [Oikopleura dioica]|uniref:Uncharacterized protein n=1 Tax=Oikopleura dioica TaxID=34765 RepID=E4Z234_OIKDI|nr:unnamed protein product [Oikopleura dioica]
MQGRTNPELCIYALSGIANVSNNEYEEVNLENELFNSSIDRSTLVIVDCH